MDLVTKYLVIGMMLILYSSYNCIIILAISTYQIYLASINYFPQCPCPTLIKMTIGSLGQNRKIVYYKHFYYVF